MNNQKKADFKSNKAFRISVKFDDIVNSVVDFINTYCNESITANKLYQEILLIGLKQYLKRLNVKYPQYLSEIEKLQNELKLLQENPWDFEEKRPKSIIVDIYYYNLILEFTDLDNIIFSKYITASNIFNGILINGLDYYIKMDKLAIESMDLNIDYDYYDLFHRLESFINKNS